MTGELSDEGEEEEEEEDGRECPSKLPNRLPSLRFASSPLLPLPTYLYTVSTICQGKALNAGRLHGKES